MRNLFLISIVLFIALACHHGGGDSPEPIDKAYIEWETPVTVTGGSGYPRVHRLNDGRYMMVYSSGYNAYYKLSEDGCQTWQTRVLVAPFFYVPDDVNNDGSFVQVTQANSEFAQLSETNPYHPGRIIYANNHRTVGNRSSVYPFSIAITVSDDNLASWSEQRVVYHSEKWEGDVLKGCWEPMILELPDGRVQIYFADETLTYAKKRSDAYIACIESYDGGDTWSASDCRGAKQVCYTEGSRDGMPVAMYYDGRIYVSIESNPKPQKLHPQIVFTSPDNPWSEVVLADSPYRFEPVQEHPDWNTTIGGGTYLIETENYLVQSYQTDNGMASITKNREPVVNFCHKSEVVDGKWTTMRGNYHPLGLNLNKDSCLWNSLCSLGDDTILLVGQMNNNIITCKGKIISPTE